MLSRVELPTAAAWDIITHPESHKVFRSITVSSNCHHCLAKVAGAREFTQAGTRHLGPTARPRAFRSTRWYDMATILSLVWGETSLRAHQAYSQCRWSLALVECALPEALLCTPARLHDCDLFHTCLCPPWLGNCTLTAPAQYAEARREANSQKAAWIPSVQRQPLHRLEHPLDVWRVQNTTASHRGLGQQDRPLRAAGQCCHG